MTLIRFLLAAFALLALSACYTSKEPLVGDDAVAPYATITFVSRSESDAKPVVFRRDGNGYVTIGENGEQARLHLKPVEGDFYIAQLSGEDDGEAQYLYGFMRLDAAGKVAEAWRTFGTTADVRPGLSTCDDVICIDDLAAYVAYGQEAVAAGEEPTMAFDIAVE